MGTFDVNVLQTTHQDIMYFLSYFVCSTEEPSIPFVVWPPTNGLCSQLFVFFFLFISFLLDSIYQGKIPPPTAFFYVTSTPYWFLFQLVSLLVSCLSVCACIV